MNYDRYYEGAHDDRHRSEDHQQRPDVLAIAPRRRWRTNSVVMVDKGDYIIVRPLPTDIASALEGLLPPANALTTAQQGSSEPKVPAR
jgi:hypothetical protein